MTLSTQTSKTAFAGNGVTCVFPLPFPFIREADIRALLRQDGADTALTPGTHYSLAGAGSTSGGSLTLNTPPATGQTLVVWRVPAIVQEVDYVENSAFPAETHEAALDLLTMICQSLQEQIDRAVLYPVSTPEADILDSDAFLDATAANKLAAQAARLMAEDAAQNAGLSAASANTSAVSAAASAALADVLAGGGTVRVSPGDSAAQTLSAKLLAGNGLSETIESPGAAEALRLAVALAASPGLEFAGGLLRVKASSGLLLGAGGLAVDVGTTANKLVQLDGSARLPAVDGSQLTGIGGADQGARDLAAMDAFIAQMNAGRASGPLPGGYLHLFATDELATKTNATYDSGNKRYTNAGGVGSQRTITAGMLSTTGDIAGWSAAGMVDGSTAQGGSYINTNAAVGSGYKMDFGSSVNLTRFRLFRQVAAAPYGFVVRYSDNGTSYTDCMSAMSLAAGWNNLDFASVGAHRYWWIVTTLTADGVTQYVTEIEAYDYLAPSNVTLVPAAITAGTAPAAADLYLLHKAIDSVTLNTDLKVRASRDNGANWSAYASLAALCDYDATFKLLKASADFTGLAAGASVKWEITSYNNKSQQWRGVAALLR